MQAGDHWRSRRRFLKAGVAMGVAAEALVSPSALASMAPSTDALAADGDVHLQAAQEAARWIRSAQVAKSQGIAWLPEPDHPQKQVTVGPDNTFYSGSATTLDRLSAHDFRMLRQFLGQQEAADARHDAAAFVEANSNFRAVWLGAVPNKQLRELIERHDDHVQWVRHVTLEDTKVRKKAIAGLRKILDALQGGKPAAVSAAMLSHLDTAEQVLATVLENMQHDRTPPGA